MQQEHNTQRNQRDPSRRGAGALMNQRQQSRELVHRFAPSQGLRRPKCLNRHVDEEHQGEEHQQGLKPVQCSRPDQRHRAAEYEYMENGLRVVAVVHGANARNQPQQECQERRRRICPQLRGHRGRQRWRWCDTRRLAGVTARRGRKVRSSLLGGN